MGLELRGAGLLRGAFGSGSPAGPARLVTGSTFPGARPARLRGSRRSRQPLGAGRGAGLRRWLLLSGSGPEGRGASRSAPRAGEADGDQDGRSVPPGPTASGSGARGPGPAESGLITYSVLQVLGLALATPLAAQGGGRPHSPPSPPLLKAAEAGHRPPERLRLVPAGPDSRSRFSIRLPRPRAREGRAQWGRLPGPGSDQSGPDLLTLPGTRSRGDRRWLGG